MNYFSSDKESPESSGEAYCLPSSLIASVENDLFELNNECIQMDNVIQEIYSFHLQLKGIITDWEALLTPPLILKDPTSRTVKAWNDLLFEMMTATSINLSPLLDEKPQSYVNPGFCTCGAHARTKVLQKSSGL